MQDGMAGASPQRPWERNPSSSTSGRAATPLGPSLPGDGQPRPWDGHSTNTIATGGGTAATVPQSSSTALIGQYQSNPTTSSLYTPGYRGPGVYGANTYGGYGYRSPFGSGYGYGGSYGSGYSSVGGYGSYYQPSPGYGSGYGSPYQSSIGYGSTYGAPYQSSLGMGPYGTLGRPYGPGGLVAPGEGHTPAWQTFLQSLHRVVDFFGRVSFLVDENAQALHFFISALLQLLDRAGSLYGELARYVLRLLGWRRTRTKQLPQGVQNGLAGHRDGNQPSDTGGSAVSNMHETQDVLQVGWNGRKFGSPQGGVPVGYPVDSFRTAWQERTS